MSKIKADCYFKKKEYEKAEEIYNNILGIDANDPMVHFNLGLCSFFNDKKNKAIAELEKACEIFLKENNNIKVRMTVDIMDKLKSEKQ